MLREIKPKNARSARALAKRAPLVAENPKKVLFLRSTSSSSLVNSLVADLYSLKRPLAVRFKKKNAVHPFEDPSSLEFFSQKNDASLICFSSHSKKRPHCLTFIRCFDGRILDMLECTILQGSARIMMQFGGSKCRTGTKPLLSFSGTQFEAPKSISGETNQFAVAKSMFIDFFRGEEAKELDVEGLQMMISFAATEEQSAARPKQVIHMRVWRILTRRSGQRLPRVEVEEIGPRIDFVIGRVRDAEESTLKEALKQSAGPEARTKKNIETDIMGDKIGRIHLGRQDLHNLQTRKAKGLKRGRDDSIYLKNSTSSGVEDGDGPNMDDMHGVNQAPEGSEDATDKRQRTA